MIDLPGTALATLEEIVRIPSPAAAPQSVDEIVAFAILA